MHAFEDIERLLYWWEFEDKRRAALPVWRVARLRYSVPVGPHDFYILDQGLTLDQAQTRCGALRRANPSELYQPLMMPTAPRSMF